MSFGHQGGTGHGPSLTPAFHPSGAWQARGHSARTMSLMLPFGTRASVGARVADMMLQEAPIEWPATTIVAMST